MHRLVALGLEVLDLAHNALSAQHLAEDDVLPVEVGRDGGRDEELTAVGARACVGHGQQERLVVLELEVLVLELLAVDGLAPRSVACREVAALDHEGFDDPVEARTLVAERLAGLALPLLARAEGSKVLGRLGDDVIVLGERPD